MLQAVAFNVMWSVPTTMQVRKRITNEVEWNNYKLQERNILEDDICQEVFVHKLSKGLSMNYIILYCTFPSEVCWNNL